MTNISSRKKMVLVSLGAGLLAAAVSISFQVTIMGHFASAASGFASSFPAPGLPERLIIPAIGVNAAVQDVGLFWNGDGAMSIPTNFTDVGWYDDGPRPGMAGNAVIDGHLDGRNVKEAVFYNLDKLVPGDLVEVQDSTGKILKFQVVKTEAVPYNATTTDIFFGDHSAARLNLITCAGDWINGKNMYNERTVVFTELLKN
jgi:LPXTG-site transpeptidase (sortase) family protein